MGESAFGALRTECGGAGRGPSVPRLHSESILAITSDVIEMGNLSRAIVDLETHSTGQVLDGPR